MPPKKLPYNKLKKTAKYYRDNPNARKVKAKKDKEINQRPEQRKKRTELTTERRRRGIAGKSSGDLAHTKNGLKRKSVSANRGSKSDTKGDRNARGTKRKK